MYILPVVKLIIAGPNSVSSVWFSFGFCWNSIVPSDTFATLLFHSVFGRVYSSFSFTYMSVVIVSFVMLVILYLYANLVLYTISLSFGGFPKSDSNFSAGKSCLLFIVINLGFTFVLFTPNTISFSLGSIVVSLWSPMLIPISASSNPGIFPLCPSMNVYGPFT